MAAPHAFLDILAQPQVRDAFLAGRISLILSADLNTVLWANGSGARFLGFHTVAEALHAASGLAPLARRAIEVALADARPAALRGIEGERDFLAGRISLAPWGEAVFLRSAGPAAGAGAALLTEGLNDDSSEAALVDDQGRLMAAARGFDPAILAEPDLPPLLAAAQRDGAVKKRFLGAAEPYPAAALRLNKEPPVLLLIAAKTAAAAGAESGAAFVFDAGRLPARFGFRADAEGRFIYVSPELAEVVGPLYGAIAGRRFAALAQAWQMDQDGAVRALLQSGNPWSGQILAWPAEGTAQRAQIALSALPVYGADRQFKGFRGFGLIEKMVDNMTEITAGKSEDKSRDLSREEQEAFFAIARRLGGHNPAAREAAAEAEAGAGAGEEAAAEIAAEQEAANAAALRAAQTGAAAHMSAQAARIAALEAELRELHYSSSRQSFLLNALSEAVAVMDKNSIVLFANEAAGRLFGRSAAGLRGARLADLFDAAGRAALESDIAEAEARQAGLFLKPGREAATRGAAGSEAANGETAGGEAANGETGGGRRLRLNFGGLEAGQGYFLLMRDMTRFHDIISALLRRNSEEAEAGRRQARYLALISHEIRTPLAALLGMAQFMAEEKAGPIENAKYKDYLRDMATAGGHIMTLLNDVLHGSGEKADWLKMAVQPMPLFGALSEALALMTPQANAANIIMRAGVARDLPPVLADARAVKQILLNLLSNAVHFTPEGGQIIISAHELQERALPAGAAAAPGGGRCILVRISDTGIGMSEEEIARTLRDPLAPAAARAAEAELEQAAAAESGGEAAAPAGRRHGAGLGLPVARALAEANGIGFSLSSEPGRGTVASLVFRVAEAAKTA